MDTWDLETLLLMSELGNTLVNEIYEADLSREMKKPNAETDAFVFIFVFQNEIFSIFRVTRRTFIEKKYVQKAFLRPLPNFSQIDFDGRTKKRQLRQKNRNDYENESNPNGQTPTMQ